MSKAMWPIVIIAVGVLSVWFAVTSKEFYYTGESCVRGRKAPKWLGRLVFLLGGGLALWYGIRMLLR